MTAHTPGEWKKFRTPKGYFICAVSDDQDDKDIIEVYDSENITTAEFEHNANLVCAAPELLDALENFAEYYEPDYISAMADDNERSILDEIMDAARAAIAKAKGS